MKTFSPAAAAALKSRGLWDDGRMVVEEPRRSGKTFGTIARAETEAAPRGCYFTPEVERRRRLFYADMAGAGLIEGWVISGSHAAPRYRERPVDLVVNVPEGPKSPDKWLAYKSDHPLDRMIAGKRAGLGDDRQVAGRRYQAGMLWHGDFLKATGQEGMVGPIGERVDSSPNPDGSVMRRLAAVERRRRVTASLKGDQVVVLDQVCGEGVGVTALARTLRRDHTTIRYRLLRALDILCGAYSIEELSSIPFLRVEDAETPRKRAKAAPGHKPK